MFSNFFLHLFRIARERNFSPVLTARLVIEEYLMEDRDEDVSKVRRLGHLKAERRPGSLLHYFSTLSERCPRTPAKHPPDR